MDINLIQQIIERPKRRSFGANAVRITRSGLSSNPTQRLNYVGGDVFANNVLAKHGDNFFIGGDTATFEYDFSTKVAGSVAECPCRIYYQQSDLASLPNPSTGWSEYGTGAQSVFDLIKSQDGSYKSYDVLTSGKVSSLLIEIDLTPLANAYFGGSNSALKSALKAINVDAWAMGSGSNGGVSTNGCILYLWNDTSAVWSTAVDSGIFVNNTATIAKIYPSITDSAKLYNRINNSNKAYLLIASKYASDGTIASSVSLDYINVKVDLTRSVDTVQPISVNLPKYFAMFIKGISSSYDYTYSASAYKSYAYMDMGNNNNVIDLYRNSSDKTIRARIVANGDTKTCIVTPPQFSKFQVANILLTVSNLTATLYVLYNNGTVIKNTVALTNNMANGLYTLYFFKDKTTSYNCDAFSDIFGFIDLTGKPSGYTDAEAEGILRGQLKTKNLFDKSKAILNGFYDVTNTWVVNASYYSTDYITCKPNTIYCHNRGSNSTINFYDANKNWLSSVSAQSFTTPPNALYFRVYCGNAQKTVDQFQVEEGSTNTTYEPYMENPIAIENRELFDINAVSLHANATRANGVITLNATGDYQKSYIDIPTLSNNKYELKCAYNGGRAYVNDFYNNISLGGGVIANTDGSSVTYVTNAKGNKLRLYFDSWTSRGTFTFSNISLKLKM